MRDDAVLDLLVGRLGDDLLFPELVLGLVGAARNDFLGIGVADAWERYLPGPIAEDAGADAVREAAAEETQETNDAPSPQAVVLNSRPVPAGRGLPNSPTKSRLVSMSQFKAGWGKRWAKGRSLLKQVVGKAIGVFVATRS